MNKVLVRRSGLAALLLLFLHPLLYGEEPPVWMSFREEPGDSARDGAGRVLAMQFENRSGKVVAAYVIRIEHREPGAAKPAAVEVASTMTSALGFSKGRPGFQPGERWTDRVAVRETSEAPTVSLDLVMYADGSHWGPDKSKRLDWLKGIRTGAGLERQR
jgi:hypothetical protein